MPEFPPPSQLAPWSSGSARARDTLDNPFETPQPRQRAHRQESPDRFREDTVEFNNMTPDSRMDMLYKAMKETRREKRDNR